MDIEFEQLDHNVREFKMDVYEQQTTNHYQNFKEFVIFELKKGHHEKALQFFKEELIKTQENQGINSQEYYYLYSEVIKLLCEYSMKLLKKEDFKSTLALLVDLESIVEEHQFDEQKVLVYNNMGCLYRRIQKPKKGLQYLQKGLKLVVETKNDQLAASTYLNLCAVLSGIGNHQRAFQYAKNGLIFAQNDLMAFVQKDPFHLKSDPLYVEKTNLMAISYYNLGVECDYLLNFDKALTWYMKSYETIRTNIGETDMFRKFKNAYDVAKQKYDQTNLDKIVDSSPSTNKFSKPKQLQSKTQKQIVLKNNFTHSDSNNFQLKKNKLFRKNIPNTLTDNESEQHKMSTKQRYIYDGYQTDKNSQANLNNYKTSDSFMKSSQVIDGAKTLPIIIQPKVLTTNNFNEAIQQNQNIPFNWDTSRQLNYF